MEAAKHYFVLCSFLRDSRELFLKKTRVTMKNVTLHVLVSLYFSVHMFDRTCKVKVKLKRSVRSFSTSEQISGTFPITDFQNKPVKNMPMNLISHISYREVV
jgi:hypothetical protein